MTVFRSPSALVHNDEECRVETQMEPVAVFDFYWGIDLAGLALVARRLNHNIGGFGSLCDKGLA